MTYGIFTIVNIKTLHQSHQNDELVHIEKRGDRYLIFKRAVPFFLTRRQCRCRSGCQRRGLRPRAACQRSDGRWMVSAVREEHYRAVHSSGLPHAHCAIYRRRQHKRLLSLHLRLLCGGGRSHCSGGISVVREANRGRTAIMSHVRSTYVALDLSRTLLLLSAQNQYRRIIGGDGQQRRVLVEANGCDGTAAPAASRT